MAAISTQVHLILFLIAVAFFVILVALISRRRFKKKTLLPRGGFPEFKKEPLMPLNRAIFVDLSPKSADVVELAVEVWRMNSRIVKTGDGLTEVQKRPIMSSLQKFTKFLDRYDIKIVDHTGEKYNEGMNVDVLSFEKDPRIKNPIIKETIEPSIICNGYVVKKGKVVVINN